MNKKEWMKPELVVLVRSKPEEAVLALCKSGTAAGAAVSNAGAECYLTGCGADCVAYAGTGS